MKKLAALLALALAAVALVACGDDEGTTTTDTGTAAEEAAGGAAAGGEEDGGGGEDSGSTVEFEAVPDGGLAYVQEEASAQAGQVTVEFENPQAIPHDVAIESPDGEQVGKTDVIVEDEATATVKLKPGEYTFYCTVPGHREAGMEGTLTAE